MEGVLLRQSQQNARKNNTTTKRKEASGKKILEIRNARKLNRTNIF